MTTSTIQKNTTYNVTETGRNVVYKNRLPSSGDDAKVRVWFFPVSDATFTAAIELSTADAAEWIPLRDAPAGTALSFTGSDSVIVDIPSSCDLAVNVSAVSGTVRVGASRVNS